MNKNLYDILEEQNSKLAKIEGLAFVLYDSLSSGSTEQDRKHENAALLLLDLITDISKSMTELYDSAAYGKGAKTA